MEIVLTALLLTALALQCIYHLAFFYKLIKYEDKPLIHQAPPVTVLICARNEAENLRTNLPFILEQDYPNFEVRVIDDRSTDDTSDVLQEIAARNQHFHYVFVKDQNNGWQGKKRALTIGVDSSEYDLLLLTDADCRPTTDQWIRQMVARFQSHTEIVLGYSPYKKGNGMLNALIRYETFQTALQFLSFALRGLPYMGVGRNLAYRKSLFNRNNGLEDHKHLISGDDDLFVNMNADSVNTTICIDKETYVESTPKASWAEWFRQKRRHMSAGFQYKPVHKLLLSGYVGSQLLFYLSIIGLLVSGVSLGWIAFAYGMRMSLMILIYSKAMKQLNVGDLLLYVPLLDVLYTIYYIVFLPYTILKPNLTWK